MTLPQAKTHKKIGKRLQENYILAKWKHEIIGFGAIERPST